MNFKKLFYLILLIALFISHLTLAQSNKSGWDLIAQQDFSNALLKFDHEIQINPNDANLLMGRATCHLMLGDYNAAENSIIKALSFRKDQADILFLAGNIYFQLKQYSKAITYYSLSIDNNKSGEHYVNELDLFYNRGNSYFSSKDYSRASDDFIHSIIKGDNSPDVHLLTAKAFSKTQNKRAACDYYIHTKKMDSTLFDQGLYDYCTDYETFNPNKYHQSTDTSEVFDKVDINPKPICGMTEFYDYLSQKMLAPKKGLEYKTQGKVIIHFIVNRDGSLSEVRAMKGIGEFCDLQAVDIIKNSPTWYPGYNNGLPVRVRKILPMDFICQFSNADH